VADSGRLVLGLDSHERRVNISLAANGPAAAAKIAVWSKVPEPIGFC